MTTPQMLSYVRAKSAAGVPKATIRLLLSTNGWSEQDISEAFATVAPETAVAPAGPALQSTFGRTAAEMKTVQQDSFIGRKLVLSLGLIFISAGYAVWLNLGGSQTAAVTTSTVPNQTSTVPISISAVAPTTSAQTASQTTAGQAAAAPKSAPAATATTQPAKTVTAVPTPAPKTPAVTPTPVQTPVVTPVPVVQKPTGMYADGSYNGNAVDAYYGTVQVKAVVQNGQLADVQFLQYPNDRSNSRFINSRAMPLLTQEAIQAQSANVNGVSGATFTSQAFQQSLASALALAKN